MSSQNNDLEQLLALAESATNNLTSTLNGDAGSDSNDDIIINKSTSHHAQAFKSSSKFAETSTDEEQLQHKLEMKRQQRTIINSSMNDNNIEPDSLSKSKKSIRHDKQDKKDKKDKKNKKDKKDKKDTKDKKDKKSSKKDKNHPIKDTKDKKLHSKGTTKSYLSDSHDNALDMNNADTNISPKSIPSITKQPLLNSDSSDSDLIAPLPYTPQKVKLSKYVQRSSVRLDIASDDSDDGHSTSMRSSVKVRQKRTKTPTKEVSIRKEGQHSDDDKGYGELKGLFTPDKEERIKKRSKPTSGNKMTEKQRKLEQEKLKKAEIVKLKQTSTVHITKNSASIVDSLFDDLDQSFSSITTVNKAKVDLERAKLLEQSWIDKKKKKLLGEKQQGFLIFGQSSSSSDGDATNKTNLFGFSASSSSDSDFDLNINILNHNLNKTNSIDLNEDLEYDENENLVDSKGNIIHSHLHGKRTKRGSDDSSDGELSSALDSDLDDPLDPNDDDNSDTTDQETWDRDGKIFHNKMNAVELAVKQATELSTNSFSTSSINQPVDIDLSVNENNDMDYDRDADNNLFLADSKPSNPTTTTTPCTNNLTSSTTITTTASKFSLFDDNEDDTFPRKKTQNNVLTMMKKNTTTNTMPTKATFFELDDDDDSSDGLDDSKDIVLVRDNKETTPKKSTTALLALNSLLSVQNDVIGINQYNSSSESEDYGLTPEKRRQRETKRAKLAKKQRLQGRKSLMGDTSSDGTDHDKSSTSSSSSEEETEEIRQLRLERRVKQLEQAQRTEKETLRKQEKNKYLDMNDVDESDGEGGVKARKKEKKRENDDLFQSSSSGNSSGEDDRDGEYLSREELLEQARFLADDDEVAAELRKKGGGHTGKGSIMEQEEEEWIQDVKREEKEFIRQQMARVERERQKNRMFRHSFFDSGFAHDDMFSNNVIFDNSDLDKHQQRLLQQIQIQRGRELTQEEIDIILGGNAERRALKQQLKQEQQDLVDARYSIKSDGASLASITQSKPSTTLTSAKSTTNTNNITSIPSTSSKPIISDSQTKKGQKIGSESDGDDGASGGLSLVARLNRTLLQYTNPNNKSKSKKRTNTDLTATNSAASVQKTDSGLKASNSFQKVLSLSSHRSLSSQNSASISPLSSAPTPTTNSSFFDIGDDEQDPGNVSTTHQANMNHSSLIVPTDTHSTTSLSLSPISISGAQHDLNHINDISTDHDNSDDRDDDDNTDEEIELINNSSSDDDRHDLEGLDELDCPNKDEDPQGYAHFQTKLKQRDEQRERQQLLLLAQHHGSKLLKMNQKSNHSLFSSGTSLLNPTAALQRSGTSISRQGTLLSPNSTTIEARSLHRSNSTTNQSHLTPTPLNASFSSIFTSNTQRTTSIGSVTASQVNKSTTIKKTTSSTFKTQSFTDHETRDNNTNNDNTPHSMKDFSVITGVNVHQDTLNADLAAVPKAARKSTSLCNDPSNSTKTDKSTTTSKRSTTKAINTPTSGSSLFAAPARQNSLHPALSLISIDNSHITQQIQVQQLNNNIEQGQNGLFSNFDQAFASIPSFSSSMNLSNTKQQTGPGKTNKKQIVLSRDIVTLDKEEKSIQLSHQNNNNTNPSTTTTKSNNNNNNNNPSSTVASSRSIPLDFTSLNFDKNTKDATTSLALTGPVKHKTSHLFDQYEDDLIQSAKKQRRSTSVSSLKPINDSKSSKSLLSSLKSTGPSKK